MEKGLIKIKEFVEGELEDVGYFDYKEIKFDEEYAGDYYYTVIIKTMDEKEKDMSFKYDKKEDKIYIELGEDNFNEISDYNYTIKYFWMVLLKWEV